jgi:hypothetical protein
VRGAGGKKTGDAILPFAPKPAIGRMTSRHSNCITPAGRSLVNIFRFRSSLAGRFMLFWFENRVIPPDSENRASD